MKLDSIDLNVENYSINEIKTLFKLTDIYTSDDIQDACGKYLKIIADNEEIKIKDKILIGKFFSSLKVVLIRHLNGNEGMFNNLENVNNLENNNHIIGESYEIDNKNNNRNNNINSIEDLNNNIKC